MAELYAMAGATNELEKVKLHTTTQLHDNLNAFNCMMQSRCVGSDKGEIEDFKLYKEEIEVSDREMTPEEQTNVIMMMARAGILKPEGGE